MSVQSVNLLKERVLRAAIAAVDELESRERIHTKASRELVRAVTALRAETWRIDEAPSLIKSLVQIIELQPDPASVLGAHIKDGTNLTLLKAKAFLGERKVEDDTTPDVRPPRRGILRRKGG